ARAERGRELFVEALKLLASGHYRRLRHPQVAMQRQRAIAPLDHLLPARLFLREQLLRLGPRRGRLGRGLARLGEARLGRLALLGPPLARRVLVAARGGIAVHRPGDRFEQRGLAGAVWSDDAGDAVAEHDLGVGMLAEVGEPQALQLHAVPLSALAALSRYSTPSFTNVSRFNSASSGRRPRKSRTVSVRVWRRVPLDPALLVARCASGRRRSSWKFSARALYARIAA